MTSSPAICRLVSARCEQPEHLELALGEVDRQRRQRRLWARPRPRAPHAPRHGPAAAGDDAAPPRRAVSAGRCGRARRARAMPSAAASRRAAGRAPGTGHPAGTRTRRCARGAGSRPRQRRQHRRPGQDPARVVRVQPHQFPLLRLAAAPARSQTPVGTATRPRSCTSPARYTSVGIDTRHAGRRQPGPAARPHANAPGSTATSGRRRRRSRPAPRRAGVRRRRSSRGAGSAAPTAAQTSSGPESVGAAPPAPSRKIAAICGVEGTTGPAGHRRHHLLAAADGVEHRDRDSQRPRSVPPQARPRPDRPAGAPLPS